MSKKNKVKRTNRHHRLSRSRTDGVGFNGKIFGVENVQVVDYKKHNAFHQLFVSTHPVEMARELNNYWCDPNYVMVAVPKDHARKLQKQLAQFT